MQVASSRAGFSRRAWIQWAWTMALGCGSAWSPGGALAASPDPSGGLASVGVAAQPAASTAGAAVCLSSGRVFVLGDSIGMGLAMSGFALRLLQALGVPSDFDVDPGRSITGPGTVLRTSALQAVQINAARLARASVVLILLGTNQTEASFADSQIELVRRLREAAPQARLIWVDIGATLARQAAGWSARNRLIYERAATLGYTVVSRYRAIFGPQVNPLAIKPGQNFPGLGTEPGFGDEGNVHGADPALADALLAQLRAWAAPTGRC